ncbi:hypothetical protein [Mycoplasma nasistruthionis]|uniref:Uncharacterized protein n=1 Tax=Mycoplasma nasistruthionis TaxID=353852 RepID=A0A5B7XVS3_9MOLU|nr:hypothetical protein [Mycoplasma nasistruthionis]QCZ36545.1 hypothetical protein FG904_00740 [Mycoplasma nasistruthionis]
MNNTNKNRLKQVVILTWGKQISSLKNSKNLDFITFNIPFQVLENLSNDADLYKYLTDNLKVANSDLSELIFLNVFNLSQVEFNNTFLKKLFNKIFTFVFKNLHGINISLIDNNVILNFLDSYCNANFSTSFSSLNHQLIILDELLADNSVLNKNQLQTLVGLNLNNLFMSYAELVNQSEFKKPLKIDELNSIDSQLQNQEDSFLNYYSYQSNKKIDILIL